MPRKIDPVAPLAEVASQRAELEAQFLALIEELTLRVDSHWPMAHYRLAENIQAWYREFKDLSQHSQCSATIAILDRESAFALGRDFQEKFRPAQEFLQALETQAAKVRPAAAFSSLQLDEARNECAEYGSELLLCRSEVQLQWMALQNNAAWRFQHNPAQCAPQGEFQALTLAAMGIVLGNTLHLSLAMPSPEWRELNGQWDALTKQMLMAVQYPTLEQARWGLHPQTRHGSTQVAEMLREKQLQHLQQESDEVQADLLEVSLDLLALQMVHGQVPTMQDFRSGTHDFWWGLGPADGADASVPHPPDGEVAVVGMLDP